VATADQTERVFAEKQYYELVKEGGKGRMICEEPLKKKGTSMTEGQQGGAQRGIVEDSHTLSRRGGGVAYAYRHRQQNEGAPDLMRLSGRGN